MFLCNLSWRRWIPIFVAVGAIGLLIALLVPALYSARNAAWRSQSKNNLKQLGLALHNYHDTHRCFPPGAVVGEDGTAFHGWYMFAMPFMDASPLYNRINSRQPWNDPENAHLFRFRSALCSNPSVSQRTTVDGFFLLHYMGNPNVLHRNSSVAVDDLTVGTNHTWLAGETAAGFQPYGYPFNWRPLGRLEGGPNGYGSPLGGGVSLLLGDGAVREFATETDPEVLDTLASAPPVPSEQDTQTPPVRFEYGGSEWRITGMGLDDLGQKGRYALIQFDPEGVPETVEIVRSGKQETREPRIDDLRKIAAAYPNARKLFYAPVIDDAAARVLVQFKELELVRARGIRVSDQGIEDLRQLPKLTFLCTEELARERLDRLRAALPKCAIRVERVLP